MMTRWQAGSGRDLHLEMQLDDFLSGAHPGPCDEDVARLCVRAPIKAQTEKWDPETLKAELSDYGAWDDEDLAHHGQNIQRMVWIACGDIQAEEYEKGRA